MNWKMNRPQTKREKGLVQRGRSCPGETEAKNFIEGSRHNFLNQFGIDFSIPFSEEAIQIRGLATHPAHVGGCSAPESGCPKVAPPVDAHGFFEKGPSEEKNRQKTSHTILVADQNFAFAIGEHPPFWVHLVQKEAKHLVGWVWTP